jgi:hypothetical protein
MPGLVLMQYQFRFILVSEK